MKTAEGKPIGEADYTVRLWSIPDEMELQRSPAHGAMIHTVAVSPDGTQIVSGDSDGAIRSWHIDDWSHVKEVRAHESSVWRIIYGAECMVSYSSDGTIAIWQSGDLVLERTFPSCGKGLWWDIALSPDGGRIALANTFLYWITGAAPRACGSTNPAF